MTTLRNARKCIERARDELIRAGVLLSESKLRQGVKPDDVFDIARKLKEIAALLP